jgi:outer membrane receptor protein involved in Fe transport
MRIATVLAVALLGTSSLAVAQHAHAAIQHYQLDIPRQALDTALKDLAQQTGLQIGRFSERIDGSAMVGPVKGEQTPEQAIKTLLLNTGLNYKIVSDTTIAVYNPKDATGAQISKDGAEKGTQGGDQKKSFWDPFRVAEADAAAGAQLSGQVAAGGAQEAQVHVQSGQKVKQQPEQAEEISEIVVTARKREERLVDVPISIVAVGAEELRERQIVTLDNLPPAVPGLSLVKTGNAATFEIRGVSNLDGGGNPLIGLYIDEADATLPGSASLQPIPATYDLDRVEVLRGPQGTLYGEGSAGGTIHLVTKSPNLDTTVFDSQVTALFTEGGSPSQRINAMVNVPLINDQLALRVASTFEHDGGWIDQPAAGQRNINGGDLTDVRIKGLWRPDPSFTLSAMVNINRTDRGLDYSDLNSPQTYTQLFDLTTTPSARKDHDLYNLTMTYDWAPVARVLNTVTYLHVDDTERNYSISAQYLPPDQFPPYEIYEPSNLTQGHLFADEFRLTSTGSGRWQWVVGGLYRYFQDELPLTNSYFALSGTPLSAAYSITSGSEARWESWSVFGDTSYQFGERLTLGAGARYFHENQEVSDLVALTHQDGKFHSTDPRVYAQYKLSSNANVYASAAKGFRSGGFNLQGQPPFGPEDVWTYELGAKGIIADSKVSFDGAAYLTNYSQYQMYAQESIGQILIFNAGSVRIKGVEADLTWNPLDHWRLEARGTYVNARFTEINATKTVSTVGDPLDDVPRYQFTLSGQYDFSWLAKHDVVRLDYNETSSLAMRDRSIGPWYYASSPVIQMLNLHMSSMLKDNLRVGFSVQNLLNDQSYVSPSWYLGQGARSRPRTYGVEFSATFN